MNKKRHDMWDGSITLREEDFTDEALDDSAHALRVLIDDLDDRVMTFNALAGLMLGSAYWTEVNFDQQYGAWKQSNEAYQSLKKRDRTMFDAKIKQCLVEAESSFGWGRLRGALAERVVEKAFDNYCKSQVKGIMGVMHKGCAVYLNGEKVSYQCDKNAEQQRKCRREAQYCAGAKKDGCDGSRETVDLGVVTLLQGNAQSRLDCVETKLSPKGFCYLEAEYLTKLRKKLTTMGADHDIIVASLERHSMIESRVKTFMEDRAGFSVWGIEEIRNWYFCLNVPQHIAIGDSFK